MPQPKRKQIPGERVKVLGVRIAGWPKRTAMALPPKRFDDRYQRPLNMSRRLPRRAAPEIEDEAEDDDIEDVDENEKRDDRNKEMGDIEKVERGRKRGYKDMENERKVDSRSPRDYTHPRAPKRRQVMDHSPSLFVTEPRSRIRKPTHHPSHHRHDKNNNHDSEDNEDGGFIPFPSPKPQTEQPERQSTRKDHDRRDDYDSEAPYHANEDTPYEYQDKNSSPSMPRPQTSNIKSIPKSRSQMGAEEVRDFFWAPAMKIPAIVHDMTGAQPSRIQLVGPTGSELIDFPDMLTELERQLGFKLVNTTFVRSDELSDLLMAFQKKTTHIEVLEKEFEEMAAGFGTQEDMIKGLRSQLKGWEEGYTDGNRYKTARAVRLGAQETVRARGQETKPGKQVRIRREAEEPRQYDEQPSKAKTCSRKEERLRGRCERSS